MRQGNKSVLSVPNDGRSSPLTHDRSSSTPNSNKISLANFNDCSILHTLTGNTCVTLLMIGVVSL
jgi:hypothetical protein